MALLGQGCWVLFGSAVIVEIGGILLGNACRGACARAMPWWRADWAPAVAVEERVAEAMQTERLNGDHFSSEDAEDESEDPDERTLGKMVRLGRFCRDGCISAMAGMRLVSVVGEPDR